ncbi:MAG: competence/damage-inducible protein A [Candidatus Omnitrophica bacterium]|nr:competence/damage-inducible protein A [Candidatus Omnitrophota bacterium]MBU1048214.1 competence/damage-inducible protein A [Candidatus Omnitrophota bacterium]MBU1631342.1 competence/damage-inducible protein A [Candidatus Omnitrophota bacterium]MBU1767135.1 competence/damage-inducible protein A [Candidatus Omnitrophota bacterium]MBU1889730.1 competence/damage-inducible protein A [Candidatus Omnitrophota bacterium]
MSAEIINVGDELLNGETVNTNAAYLAAKLQEFGIELHYQTTVGDDSLRIQKNLKRALSRSSIIIITGGLGPTKDDITKKVVADVLGKQLVSHEPTLSKIHNKLKDLTSSISKTNEKIALYPEGAQIIDNPIGTAPGIIISENGKRIILLPGVPKELKAITERNAILCFSQSREKNYVIKHQILKVWGTPEAKVGEVLEDIMGENKNPLVGLRVDVEEGVKVSITAKGGSVAIAQKLIEDMENIVKQKLGDAVYATGETSMEKVIGMLLSINKKTIAIAESITGGLISKKITDIPGSSNYFLSGMVTYSNESKIKDLKIPEELIKENGAVSEQVAKAMALAVKNISSANIGLSTTGIAGPSIGTTNKSLGLVFIGLATDNKGCQVEKYQFSGTRSMIRTKTAQTALDMVRRHLITI